MRKILIRFILCVLLPITAVAGESSKSTVALCSNASVPFQKNGVKFDNAVYESPGDKSHITLTNSTGDKSVIKYVDKDDSGLSFVYYAGVNCAATLRKSFVDLRLKYPDEPNENLLFLDVFRIISLGNNTEKRPDFLANMPTELIDIDLKNAKKYLDKPEWSGTVRDSLTKLYSEPSATEAQKEKIKKMLLDLNQRFPPKTTSKVKRGTR